MFPTTAVFKRALFLVSEFRIVGSKVFLLLTPFRDDDQPVGDKSGSLSRISPRISLRAINDKRRVQVCISLPYLLVIVPDHNQHSRVPVLQGRCVRRGILTAGTRDL